MLGSLFKLFQFAYGKSVPTVVPLPSPNQKVRPASGPVAHFQTPSVSSSVPPIHPVPAACSPDNCASSAEVMVTKYPCNPKYVLASAAALACDQVIPGAEIYS